MPVFPHPVHHAPNTPPRAVPESLPHHEPASPASSSPAQPGGAPPARPFAALGVSPQSVAVLDAMGIESPTPIQARAIPLLMAGQDIVGQAQTGSGKTLAYALPLIERCDHRLRAVQALVIVPTRELAVQVGDVIARLAAPRKIALTLLYGGRSLLPEKRMLAAGSQIVVGCPGRVLDHLRQGTLSLRNLSFLVLDEGDQMLDQGFAPDVERILAQTPRARQTALFSATLPGWVSTMVARHLHNPTVVRVDAAHEKPLPITHKVYEMAPHAKFDALHVLLQERSKGSVLVFGRTKRGVTKLALRLQKAGHRVAALQGNLSQNARERIMADFRSGRVPVLVATNVAARGIDVTDIERVINYELPESAELFTHRVGRTGRMGRQGAAITFVTQEDNAQWQRIERALGHRLPRQQFASIVAPVPALGRPMRWPASPA